MTLRFRRYPRTRSLSAVAAGVLAATALTGCGGFGIGPGAEVDAAPGKDACRLLTAHEIEQITRLPVSGCFHSDFRSDCVWGFVGKGYDPTGAHPTFVGVEVGYSDRGDFDDYRESPKSDPGTSVVSVTGIGDQAFVLSSGGGQRELWARADGRVLYIDVSLGAKLPYDMGAERALLALAIRRV